MAGAVTDERDVRTVRRPCRLVIRRSVVSETTNIRPIRVAGIYLCVTVAVAHENNLQFVHAGGGFNAITVTIIVSLSINPPASVTFNSNWLVHHKG